MCALGCVLMVSLSGCSSKVLKADDAETLLSNKEYDQSISIKEIPVEDPNAHPSGYYVRLPGPEPVPEAFSPAPTPAPTTKKGQKASAKPPKAPTAPAAGAAAPPSQPGALAPAPVAAPAAREPSIEDSEGFVGRRPAKDPYRVGEKVTLEVSYFNVVAGDMTLETRNFASVNGRRSYRFAGTARSTSVFAMFYAVDDWFETFVDYDTMVPYSYSLHVKESKQLRETRTIFDWSSNKAKFWDKKINDEKQLEEKNEEWTIPKYSQNVFTALFYLRSFTLTPGKKIQFRIAHEKENLTMTTEVVRKERIKTLAGEFNTVVVKPSIALDGVFKPVGDVFVWFTDDDRKLVVKFESKIKIGKIVASAKKVELGRP